MTTPPAGPQEDEMWWRCRCHDVVLGECPNRDKIAAALSGTAVRGGAPAALREAAIKRVTNLTKGWLHALYDGVDGGRPTTDGGILLVVADMLDRADDARDEFVGGTADRAIQADLRRIAVRLSENTVDSLDELDVAIVAKVLATLYPEAVANNADGFPRDDAVRFAAEYRRLTATAASDASEEETNG